MALFRDRTGRPGPATWEGGAPRAGQEQHPVTGVSWYEAAAYAAFRGRRLPTIFHWSEAAAPDLGDAITVVGHPMKDGSKGISLFYVILPDGKRLYHDIARPKEIN